LYESRFIISQLQKAEEELQQVKINLSNANDTIEFLTCKNKELKKQQRKQLQKKLQRKRLRK
jgi:hypothetical protein